MNLTEHFTNAGYELDDDSRLLVDQAQAHLDRIAALDSAVEAHGILISGTRGTLTINPAVPESRRERKALDDIFKRLLPDNDSDNAAQPGDRSAMGRALARQRWGTRGGHAA